MLVGQVGQGAVVRLSSFLKSLGRNQQRGHDAASHQHDAHDQGRGRQQPPCIPDPTRRVFGRIVRIAADERHDRHSRFEPREAEGKLREQHERRQAHPERIAMLGQEHRFPPGEQFGVQPDVMQAPRNQDHVQQEIHGHDRHRQPHGLAKSLEEDAAKCGEQEERERHAISHRARHHRILQDVRGCVCGGQRHRDHECGGREPQQTQDQRLAPPAWQERSQQHDAAFAVRAQLRHAAVHRQCRAQREQHEDEGRHGREHAGREEGDAGLIPERREVVHARQAHHLPPGVGVGRRRALRRTLPRAVHEPPPEARARAVRHDGFSSHVSARSADTTMRHVGVDLSSASDFDWSCSARHARAHSDRVNCGPQTNGAPQPRATAREECGRARTHSSPR